MTAHLQGSAQGTFLELHARFLAPEASAEISALTVEGVPASRILSLYPFDLEVLCANLKGHLNSTLRIGSFSWLVGNWSERYRGLRDALSAEHSQQSRLLWSRFYVLWQQDVSKDFDLEEDPNRYFALVDALEIFWIASNWHQLPELHVDAQTLAWALDELRKALNFMSWDGPMVVDVPPPDSSEIPNGQR